MRYIIDVSQTHSKKIESLIKSQHYNTVDQFITVAIENQLHIEEDEITTKRASDISDNEVKRNYKNLIYAEHLAIPEATPTFVTPPAFNQLVCIKAGLPEHQCWMWGQINRIFPIKLALRCLVKQLSGGEWVELEKYKDEAARIALEFGKMIKAYEDKRNKKREDRISAGLPSSSEDPSDRVKSLTRYKSQFIGGLRKDSKLDGAMLFLRFANIIKNDKGEEVIGITETGFEFARIENPVIDFSEYEQSLSEEEANYYIMHIYKNVPGEFNAIQWLLQKISTGISERTKLNNEITEEFGNIWEKSDAVINTQRAGLMSRISELKLIDKNKIGIQVEYLISENGNKFLKKYEEVRIS